MGCEVGAESVFRWIGSGLGDRCEAFFVSSPYVFVKPRSGCVTGCANALKTCLVSALVNSASLGNGVLEARGIGAENDFGSSVDVTIREKPAWAELCIQAHTSNGDNDS